MNADDSLDLLDRLLSEFAQRHPRKRGRIWMSTMFLSAPTKRCWHEHD